ncbi:MAG: hypothetical protein C0473_01495 [Cyanobacteria bacterium DS3.002]|nr:hypothetical protein [Cyanobacteria bacterium DS3.002]MBA4049602.1 hypothetical protein [Cyanobacteria bacterium DS2.008]
MVIDRSNETNKSSKNGTFNSSIYNGRPRTALKHAPKVRKLYADGMTKAAIARKLGIGRTSVIRILSTSD